MNMPRILSLCVCVCVCVCVCQLLILHIRSSSISTVSKPLFLYFASESSCWAHSHFARQILTLRKHSHFVQPIPTLRKASS